MPGIKLAAIRWKRSGLALLVLLFSRPALATDTGALAQALEWSGDSAAAPETETGAEASREQDVWQRIRNGFRIGEDHRNPLVAVHESWFAARPGNVRRLAERSRPYLYHIVEELDQRAMPMEIALLPMIESAFNPAAQSPSAASGIWQFIPSTGRHYGLKQDNWYDGRRDFTAATNAALDYLGKLYLDFGDWQLALAAYNCGEGCVARAIQKNVQEGRPTDYASLSLPSETRHYVPKLLALKNLIREPERYGIAIDPLPNQRYFNQVAVHASMDIHSAARLANMSSDEFIALNAAFPRKLIRSDTPVNLLVPVDKTDKFQRNLETGSWDTWQPYAAKKGERPEAIAKRFEVSLERLEEHNQLQTKNGKLARAQTILVPVKGRGAVGKAIPGSGPSHHAVQTGDTLYGVARRYGLNIAQLNEANPKLDANLKPGQLILLPLTTLAVLETDVSQPISLKIGHSRRLQTARYTVKRGDTLLAIAQRFGVGLADIRAWNPAFKKSTKIRVGQTVIVGKG